MFVNQLNFSTAINLLFLTYPPLGIVIIIIIQINKFNQSSVFHQIKKRPKQFWLIPKRAKKSPLQFWMLQKLDLLYPHTRSPKNHNLFVA